MLPSAQQGKADRAAEEERALQSRAVPFSDRSLMVRGLPVGQFDLVECQAVEFALNNVFEEFGFQDSAVVPGQGYGFVRVSVAWLCLLLSSLRNCTHCLVHILFVPILCAVVGASNRLLLVCLILL